MKKVITRFAPSPPGFYIQEMHELLLLTGYMPANIMANLSSELMILILREVLKNIKMQLLEI